MVHCGPPLIVTKARR